MSFMKGKALGDPVQPMRFWNNARCTGRELSKHHCHLAITERQDCQAPEVVAGAKMFCRSQGSPILIGEGHADAN